MFSKIFSLFLGLKLKDKIYISLIAVLCLIFISNSIYTSIRFQIAQKHINRLIDDKNAAELKAFEDKVEEINETTKKSSSNYKAKKTKSNEKIKKKLKDISEIDSIVSNANDSTKQSIQSRYEKIRSEYRFIDN